MMGKTGGAPLLRKYEPRPLPLRGPDYRIEVKKDRAGPGYTIRKQGNTITVDRPGTADDVVLRLSDDTLSISRPGHDNETVLLRSGNRLLIRREEEDRNAAIIHKGDAILVDRVGQERDVTFRRRADRFEIDRYGEADDLLVFRSGNTIFIERGPDRRRVATVQRTDGRDLDPVAWQEQLTLDPRAWDRVHRWLDRGRVDMEDLVTLSEDGRVLIWDELLR